ncbi:PDR/VanB family oxidoreductase [Acetobacter fabarum]|uniref:PDR/VanB family oxidoreductase n=1 Tax=Acetobacter fabarum TaxID=483199 RepID=UPI0039E88837
MELLVSAIRINGDNNLDIELICPKGNELPPFTPGAHIDVRTPSGQIRQYSLCGSPMDRRVYRICVRKDVSSRGGSLSLHTDLGVRAKVTVSEPRNLFAIPHARRYLLFSAGIGITPIITMARCLVSDGRHVEWHHYEGRRSSVAFLEDVSSGNLKNVTTLYLSDEGASFRKIVPECLLRPDPDTAIIACGPDGFLTLLEKRVAEAGWEPAQLYSERFRASPAGALNSKAKGEFVVQLASSGQCFTIGVEDTIGHVLLKNGIPVELSCEQGMCGACLTRVLEGVPDHKDVVLSATEREACNQIAICCSRSKSPLLVLDI